MHVAYVYNMNFAHAGPISLHGYPDRLLEINVFFMKLILIFDIGHLAFEDLTVIFDDYFQ